jgi:hypothetical protein
MWSGMTPTSRGVHVVTTTRTYKGKTYRTPLLGRSYREAGKVKKATVANRTWLGDEVVALIRQALPGEVLQPAGQRLAVVRSYHHGPVQAVLKARQRLRLESVLGARACRERTLVKAMVAARLRDPQSKLATTRRGQATTLPSLVAVADTTEPDLYAALDGLLQRHGRIEKRLGQRHLATGGGVLYALSSSYLEGHSCPLGAYGYHRDGKRGKLQMTEGLVTTREGCPVAVSVLEGHPVDATP